MAHIPNLASSGPFMRGGRGSIQDFLATQGWELSHRGKVRDSYAHPQKPEHLLVIASDRISIFDHVLNAFIPQKGAVLTALSHYWLDEVLEYTPNHLSTRALPYDYPKERATLVRKVEIMPFELIFRAHLGGSVWKQYQETGTVAGQRLPEGLAKWQKLPEPLFTPSTKAEEGHDVNITIQQFEEQAGEEGMYAAELAKIAFRYAYKMALNTGILILDTKFEVQASPFVLADEVLTPDSSRFTTVEDYELAMSEGRDPIFYDKEPIRQWGKTVETPFHDKNDQPIIGINNLDPANHLHRNYIGNSLQVPLEVIEAASTRYLQIFEMLVGVPLDKYQRERMGVEA